MGYPACSVGTYFRFPHLEKDFIGVSVVAGLFLNTSLFCSFVVVLMGGGWGGG